MSTSFDAPPVEAVLAILAQKANTDRALAAQLDAATWQAIAVMAARRPEAAEPEGEDEV